MVRGASGGCLHGDWKSWEQWGEFPIFGGKKVPRLGRKCHRGKGKGNMS